MGMKFVRESLAADEAIALEVPLHWFSWVSVALLVLAAAVTAGLSLPFAVWIAIRNLTTERALTSRRVIQKTGWISRHTDEMKLGAVENTEISQGVIGRLLGYGTVRVSGRGVGQVELRLAPDPMRVKREIDAAC